MIDTDDLVNQDGRSKKGRPWREDGVLMCLIFLSIANHKVLPLAIVYWVWGYQINKWF